MGCYLLSSTDNAPDLYLTSLSLIFSTSFQIKRLELPNTKMDISVDGYLVEMDAWLFTIIRLSERSLDAGTLTTRDIYDKERLEKKDEKKRHFGDTPTKDQKKKKRKSE